jgi:hypothetical protein
MFMDIQTSYQATVGIDWADQKHSVFVRFSDGDSYGQTIGSRPEAIQQWLLELKAKCAEGKIAIALEQRRGPLFYQLCSHLEWIDLYPVIPSHLPAFAKPSFQVEPRMIRSTANCLKNLFAPMAIGCDPIKHNQYQNVNSTSTAGYAVGY